MRVLFAGLLLAAAAGAQMEDVRIGSIEFYGLNGADAGALRGGLTVKPGDKFEWPATREKVRSELKRAGRAVTHFAPVCCDSEQRVMLYVGLVEKGTATEYRPRPSGTVKLAPELKNLYDEFMDKLVEGLKQNAGTPEDYSKGYSLSSHGPTRAVQIRMREAALAHEAGILRVLAEAADDEQRAAAAHLAGYARHSERQVAALMAASRDSNDTVRNNATRALAVLAATPEFARSIPAAPFIDGLNSAVWSDRNKSLMLLTFLTKNRDAKVLGEIKARALPALKEMAQWRTVHAENVILILARVAGIRESEAVKYSDARNAEAVLARFE